MQMFETRAGLKSFYGPSGLEGSEAGSGSSIPQKIFDVVFPVGISNEVSESTHTTSLEEACSIPLLEGNREACVPGIQQANLSPMPPASNLRILLGDGINRSPQEIQSLLAPTPEGLDGERDETPSWQGPGWIPPMLAFSSPCGGRTVLVGSRMQPSAALGVGDDHVTVDERVRGGALEAVV